MSYHRTCQPLGGRIKQCLHTGVLSPLMSPFCLSPPVQPLGPNCPTPNGPEPQHGLGRLTGLCSPSPLQEAGLVASPGGEAGESSEETCGFILRIHNAAFTHHPAFRNWALRCLVMLAGLWVNA